MGNSRIWLSARRDVRQTAIQAQDAQSEDQVSYAQTFNHLTQNMGVPNEQAVRIIADQKFNLGVSTDGPIKDYDEQLYKRSVNAAKEAGYSEAGAN